MSYKLVHQRLNNGWTILEALLIRPRKLSPKGIRVPINSTERGRAQLAAVLAVRNALLTGKLKKPPCCERDGCTTEYVEAHHHKGYAKEYQLDVVWLCRLHHSVADATLRRQKAMEEILAANRENNVTILLTTASPGTVSNGLIV